MTETTKTATPEEARQKAATRLDRLREDIGGEIEALKAEALAAHAEADERYESNVSRFHGMEEELEAARQRLPRLEAEFESLPHEAFRANMDGDGDGEARLRGRYLEVKAELPDLRGRIAGLEREMASMYDANRARGRRDVYGNVLEDVAGAVRFKQRGDARVGAATHAAREELRAFKERAVKDVDEVIEALHRT